MKQSLLSVAWAMLCLSICLPHLLSAQPQLKKWYIAGRTVNMTTVPPTLEDTLYLTNNTGAANSMYDDNGNMLFYANQPYIYDKNGVIIDSTMRIWEGACSDIEPSQELCVVPFIDNEETCQKKWYVFYSFYKCSVGFGVRAKIVTCDMSTKQATSADMVDGSNAIVNILSGLTSAPAMAASRRFGDKRYLYMVAPGGVRKVTISSENGTDNGLSSASTILSSSSYDYVTGEADLSMDGTKLGWVPVMNPSSNIFYLAIHIIGIDTLTGNWSTTNQNFTYYTGYHPTFPQLRGIEFSSNGNKVYFNTGDDGLPVDVIYVKNLVSNTVQTIPNSQNYVSSQLERGYNGLIYAAGSNYLAGISETADTIVHLFPTGYKQSGMKIDATLKRSFLLPDQIDGNNYDYYKPDILTASYNNTATWTPASNPIKANSTVLRVRDSLVFNSGANITIANLTIEFGNNAKMLIKPGARVNLVNTTLKGNEVCPLLWDGIIVDGTQSSDAQLYSYGILSPYSGRTVIKDAKFGITINGTHVGFSSIADADFSKNDYDILLNGTPGITISGCRFDGSLPLKNQIYGSNNGYTDGKKRSNTAVVAINSTSDMLFLVDTFQNYQTALTVGKSGTTITSSQFKNMKAYCANLDGAANTRNLNVQNTVFKDSKAGLRIANGYNAAFFNNNFSNITDGFAIQWRDNPNRIFQLGHVSDTTKKNTFNGCNWDAVNLYYNAGKQTSISIYRNSFINQTYARGIHVDEPMNVDSSGTFGSLNINNNKMTALGRGIALTNIHGANPKEPRRDRKINAFKAYTVDSNQIGFNNTYNAYVSGIQMSGGSRLNVWDNNVSSNSSSSWENSALNVTDAPNTLVNGNTCSAGSGLRAAGMMINSNYYCNTMNTCVTGIKLDDTHVLRPDNVTHGIVGTGSTSDARENTFTNTRAWGVDMQINTQEVNCRNNQWVFPTGTRPSIHYQYSSICGDIDAGSATYNFCDAMTPSSDTTYNQGGNFVITTSDNVVIWKRKHYQQQAYIRGEATQSSGDGIIVNLVNIEHLIANRLYTNALSALNSWSIGSNAIATDYKNVYKALVNKYIRDTGTYTPTEITTLTTVAQKNPVTTSPAAYCARAILWSEFATEFVDTPQEYYPNISGYVNGGCGTPLLNQTVYLEKQGDGPVNYNVFSNSSGQFTFWGDSLKDVTDNVSLYRIVANYGGNYQYSSPYKTINNLIYGSYNTLNCTFSKTGPTTTEVNEVNETQPTVHVYPNPANTQLMIQSDLPASQIRMSNMMGQMVLETEFSSVLNVSNLTSGIYFIEILDAKGSILHQQKLNILH